MSSVEITQSPPRKKMKTISKEGFAKEVHLSSKHMNRFSRQNAALGAETTAKLSKMHILIYGALGVGIETAKNLGLQGVGGIKIYDPNPITIQDLGLNFFFTPSDIGKPRGMVSITKLQELNPICEMSVVDSLSNDVLKSCSALVIAHPMALSELVTLNQSCRELGISFFYGYSSGVYGSIFVDHGDNHYIVDKDGERPIQKLIVDVKSCSDNLKECLIRYEAPEGQQALSITEGTFDISEVAGIEGLNGVFPVRQVFSDPVKTVRVPYEIKEYESYVSGGILLEKKTPVPFPMKSFATKIRAPGSPFDDPPSMVSTDLINFSENHHHVGFVAVHQFLEKYSRMPKLYDIEDAAELVRVATELLSSKEIDIPDYELNEEYIKKYSFYSSVELQPMSAFLGGVLAQEVVKCTGKLTPIPGFFHFSTVESLPSEIPEDRESRNSRYDYLASIYGWDFVQKLGDLKYFMVGCGALGCEFLKNFALNGVCCGNGKLIVTDPDRIELSNLSRQFLFREHNVGQPKSRAGTSMAVTMNHSFKVEALELLVSPKSEDYFTDEFWMGQDGICNALDNMEARLYVDSQCVRYEKSLLESGTMGTGGNVDTIVPFKTTTYSEGGKAADGGGVPMCTLRNFPHITDHCIEWARDQFEFLFVKLAKLSENYLSNPEAIEFDIRNKPEASVAIFEVRSLMSFLRASVSRSIGGCVQLAYDMFHYFFRDRILDLQAAFPRDHRMIEDGVDKGPFWGEKRRYPTPAILNVGDEAHMDFMISSSCLFAVLLGIVPPKQENDDDWLSEFRSKEWIIQILDGLSPPKYVPTPICTTTGENQDSNPCSQDLDNILNDFFSGLKELSAAVDTQRKHEILEFEKDDDLNFHIAFMSSAANLRCDNYSIKRTDFQSCKIIAGRIIPALATTTTAVCGLVMFELFKIAMNKDTDAYMNRQIGLAGNNFTSYSQNAPHKFRTITEILPVDPQSTPAEAWDEHGKIKEEYICKEVKRAYPEQHSVWDKIECLGSMTFRDFVSWFAENHHLQLVKWDFVLGTKGGIPYSTSIYPPKPVLNASLLPSLELSLNQATAAIMRNPACRPTQAYIGLWKECNARGSLPDGSEKEMAITESMTLKAILDVLASQAVNAEESKKIDTKVISNMSSRKIWVIPGTETPSFRDINNGEDIDKMCAIKIIL